MAPTSDQTVSRRFWDRYLKGDQAAARHLVEAVETSGMGSLERDTG